MRPVVELRRRPSLGGRVPMFTHDSQRLLPLGPVVTPRGQLTSAVTCGPRPSRFIWLAATLSLETPPRFTMSALVAKGRNKAALVWSVNFGVTM
jgi:hypothetical protein